MVMNATAQASHSYVQAMLHAPLWIVALSLIMCGSFGSQGRPGCFVDGGEEALQVVDDTGAGAGRTHRVENQCTATDPHCSDLVEGAAYAAGEVAGDSSAHPQAPSAADPLLQLDRARSLLDQANAALNRGLPVDSRRLAQHAAHVLQQADESNAQSGLLTWTLSSWEWFRVLSLKARVASTGGNATEAIVALRTAVQILESSPPRSTSPVDGRPMEMEVTRAPWHATRLCPQAPFLRGITLMDSQPASALDSSCPVHPHIIATLMDLSGEQMVAQLYSDSLATLRHVELYQPAGADSRKHFAKVVSFQRGKTLRCANQLEASEIEYHKGLALAKDLGEVGKSETAAELAKRMNELVEVLNWRHSTAEAKQIAADAAAIAGWPDPMQRPVHRFQAGLRSAPWLELDAFPTVATLAELLIDHSQMLRDECDSLVNGRAFRRQTECLHDPTRGSWGYIAVVGDADPALCTTATTPAACRWVAAAQKLVGAAEIVRVGYSKVNPSAWIRPHTGVDNTQLKLHLGLRVPDEAACATFTIGGDVRGWQQDRVIFFDDTYEHSVWNNCTTARTVLQVVIRHPDFHSDSLT